MTDSGGALLRGSNKASMRANNERLVITLLHRFGALSRAEIAARTGLSAQAVSVITRKMESEGLILGGEPQRGRVGQPSIPLALNPDGAFFIGVKVGRRSAEVVVDNVYFGDNRREPLEEAKEAVDGGMTDDLPLPDEPF